MNEKEKSAEASGRGQRGQSAWALESNPGGGVRGPK